MKKAADPNAIVVILTGATDKLFFEEKEMSSDDFKRAFQVDETRGKLAKVLLGFKLSELKNVSGERS